MNMLRYFALATTLAASAGSAWAAESVSQLINEGVPIIAAAKQAEAAQNDIKQRNMQLAAESEQLKTDQATLKTQVTAFQDQQNKVNDLVSAYKKTCAGKTLPEDKYKTCKEQETTITEAASSVNAAQAPIVKQQDSFNARVTAFQASLQQLKADAPKAASDYEVALNNEQNWLNRTRNFLLTPAVRRLANKARCADFRTAPQGVSGLNQMSDDALACLKKIKAGG